MKDFANQTTKREEFVRKIRLPTLKIVHFITKQFWDEWFCKLLASSYLQVQLYNQAKF